MILHFKKRSSCKVSFQKLGILQTVASIRGQYFIDNPFFILKFVCLPVVPGYKVHVAECKGEN